MRHERTCFLLLKALITERMAEGTSYFMSNILYSGTGYGI